MSPTASLFPSQPPAPGKVAGEILPLPDAELCYYPDWFDTDESARLSERLIRETPWRQDTIRFGGKPIPVPRLQAWYGDCRKLYGYSGLRFDPLPWTPLLSDIRERLMRELGLAFNSVLLNYYRDGLDSVAWHSDNEAELGPDPLIASLSLGTPRRFELKHRVRRELPRRQMILADGSLLLMGHGLQRYWQHQIPKEPGLSGARLNLTFRLIKPMA